MECFVQEYCHLISWIEALAIALVSALEAVSHIGWQARGLKRDIEVCDKT